MKESSQNISGLVLKALRGWHKPAIDSPNLFTELLLVQESVVNIGAGATTPDSIRLAINRVLMSAIDTLAAMEKETDKGSKIIRSRFPDGQSTAEVAQIVDELEYFVNREQGKAVKQLSKILWSLEQSLRENRIGEILSKLETTRCDSLIGREKEQAQLIDLLLSIDSDWIMALVGMGGIGKSSLIDRVIRTIVNKFHFDNVLLIKLDAQPLSRLEGHDPAPLYEHLLGRLCAKIDAAARPIGIADLERFLRGKLTKKRYLIVVDNVEEVADINYLVDRLAAFVQPGKVVITSRVRPKLDSETRVMPLGDLSQNDALKLIRHEAGLLKLERIAAGSDAELLPIYEIAGGNPYALKLMLGMLTIWSLPQTIAAVKRGRASSVGDMFDSIFHSAWLALDENAQAILFTMPLVGSGGATVAELAEFSGLSVDEVLNAILQLTHRSLIEVQGDEDSRRYSVHRLTETFIQQLIDGGGANLGDDVPGNANDDDFTDESSEDIKESSDDSDPQENEDQA